MSTVSDCFFCGAFVGEENGDGGCKGRTIGNRDVCEQCLAELKYWLQGTLARSPSMREKPIEDDDGDAQESMDESNEFSDDKELNDSDKETNSTEEFDEEESDPLTAKPIE